MAKNKYLCIQISVSYKETEKTCTYELYNERLYWNASND